MPSPIWRRARQLGLERVFGAGPAGFVAASAVGWLVDQVRSRNDVQPLDTARLKPGETYLVTTRPPMSRSERRANAKLDAAKAALADSRRPTRRVRKTAVKLSKAQRREAKASDGSRRQRRATAKAEMLGRRFDRLTEPTRKQQRLQLAIDELDRQVAEQRSKAMASARSSVKQRPRTRVFR